MFLYAALACGGCHLDSREQRLRLASGAPFYDRARQKFHERKAVASSDICAVTALVLSSCEHMRQQPQSARVFSQTARQLIQACGWNAKSHPTAAACFWFFITSQLLDVDDYFYAGVFKNSPAEWGYDLFTILPSMGEGGSNVPEEACVHAIIYILTTITDRQVDVSSSASHLCFWQRFIPRGLKPVMEQRDPVASSFPRYW